MHLAHDAPKPPRRIRSKITRGTKLLPTVHEQSHWARIMRDTFDACISHCGGDGYVSELQRLQARRIAAMEAECVHLEDRIAQSRKAGEEPPASVVDLYLRAAAAQRRHAEVLGWRPQQRDITPSLASVLEHHAKSKAGQGEGPAADRGSAALGDIDISCDSSDSGDSDIPMVSEKPGEPDDA